MFKNQQTVSICRLQPHSLKTHVRLRYVIYGSLCITKHSLTYDETLYHHCEKHNEVFHKHITMQENKLFVAPGEKTRLRALFGE